jgi:hypothetical protein
MNDIELSEFQQEVLSIPEKYDLMLSGGRGGGKSYLLALLALRYAEQYKGKSRILYIRRTHKSLADFEALTRELFGKIYGADASYNSTEKFWRLPNDAYFELGQLSSDAEFVKYQGRTFNLLICDEITQYPTPRLLDKLRSNLRGPKDLPIRVVMAGNPGGSGHMWVAKRFIYSDAAPWEPFHEEQSERTFVNCPSTYTDNPFIDQEQYEKQLTASLATDQELLKAWLEGDWSVARGAYFATVLDEKRNALDPIEELPTIAEGFAKKPGVNKRDMWPHWLAFDYGSSAPSVTYIMARSPGAEIGDRYYPKDSILILDELAFYDPSDLNKGLTYTVPHQAELIKEFCEQWSIKPEGCADDACFSRHGHSAGSIAEEFKREGVHFRRAQKADRKSGWQRMRTMLQNAGKPDKAGLYVSRKCTYFWETVPYLGRDKRNPEDLDTTAADHGADACRYGLLYKQREPLQARMGNF